MTTSMEQDLRQMTEGILNLTLEIICLLTGENFYSVRSGDHVVITASSRHFVIPKMINKKKILEVTNKIICLLTQEEQEYLEDHRELCRVEDRKPGNRPEISSSPDSMQNQQVQCHQDDVLIHIKVEDLDNTETEQLYEQADTQWKKEEEPHPEIDTVDGSSEDEASEGCLNLTQETEDVIQDSPVESLFSIDVYPTHHCTEEALDLSIPVVRPPEIVSHSLGSVVLNPRFEDLIFVGQADQKGHPQATAPPKSKRGRKRIHFDVKRFQCIECNEVFQKKLHLRKHMRSHMSERPFICSECSKSYTDTSSLMKHMKIHLTEKPFHCSACGKGFTYKGDLIKHERIHTKEKPFPCSNCGKCFTDKSGRAKHERIHTGEKPFPCPVCGKCFSRKSHMAKHQFIHTGEKPFLCQECGRCFRRKSHLTNHQILHRGEKPYVCPDCGKCFAQRPGLIIHSKIHKRKALPPSVPHPVSIKSEAQGGSLAGNTGLEHP